jgi:hypothetical protein
MQPSAPQPDSTEEGPPFWGSWRRIYWFVGLKLAITIAALYALTRFFT